MRQKKSILVYIFWIIIGAGLVAYGIYDQNKKARLESKESKVHNVLFGTDETCNSKKAAQTSTRPSRTRST